ncbi:MAG: hypothetical protein ACI8YQ_003394 [Polaribacter sp.]|jgi:hypothetical protein
MFRQFGLLLCLLICCVSCADSGEQSLTVPEDKMVDMLLDAHLLESALQDVSHTKRDSTKKAFYDQFYEIHSSSEKEFVENVDIMDKQPKMLSRIYSKIMEELSKLEAEAKQ